MIFGTLEVFERTNCLDFGRPLAKFNYLTLLALSRPGQVQSMHTSVKLFNNLAKGVGVLTLLILPSLVTPLVTMHYSIFCFIEGALKTIPDICYLIIKKLVAV